MMTDDLRIRQVDAGAARDTRRVEAIVRLANEVYAAAETGMWQPGTARTDVEEIAAAIGSGEIVVAERGDRLVGVVRIGSTERAGWFGMLAVHEAERGTGTGRRLVETAERLLLRPGIDDILLEVLTPVDESNASKRELDRWYRRMDYVYLRDDDFADHRPDLAARLATRCVFRIYHKPLPVPQAANRALPGLSASGRESRHQES
ncbi:MAG: GNAT family N-acetyltransferase [Oxalicibacterium faecigallinarum]|uniref:GNAT family N-acetyltransferase n=1 Tax=Oxalicibacterium faecigallinarum TaxID=573741 RepID=UPI0028095376|nr:GNAT family N-acetyltransferase [Oxalicibacterium faecigallinarum]MDQ7969654.1 GNAT family N-acetyltransferase [Oxalicibacterium faecigallinarum]